MKITKEFLIYEYTLKSISQIAKELNIPRTNLYKLCQRYNIKRRTYKEAGAMRAIRHECIDCHKLVSRKEYTRCRNCESKRKHKDYFCEMCGLRISYTNGLYGQKKCNSCANKGVNNPMAERRNFIAIHHIDLNRENNKKSNLLKIPQGVHSSLHHRSYDYLVKIGLIKDYIKWFFKDRLKEI